MGKKKKEDDGKPSVDIPAARRKWNFAIMRSTRALMFWRIMAVTFGIGFVLSTVWGYSHMTEQKLVPYVVEVDQSGDVQFKGVMQREAIETTDAVMRNYLIRFVTNLRAVSTDIVVVKRNLQDSYSIATPAAQNQITELVRETDPFSMSENDRRRDVEFTLFQQVTEQTWRVEWTEHIRESGALVEKVPMAGTFSISQFLPETPQQAENNPHGIWFDEFNLTEVRTGG